MLDAYAHNAKHQIEQVRNSLAQSYPGARLVVETSLASVAGVTVVGRGAPLHTLLAQVATKYVLLAGDLDTVTTWANIERGVSRVKLQRTIGEVFTITYE